MKTALLCIATGERYISFARGMLMSAERFFPQHDAFVWTDTFNRGFGVHQHYWTEALGYPEQTLRRYHLFMEASDELSQYDQIFYVDADMQFVSPVGDIFSDGITAVLHPGYFQRGMRLISQRSVTPGVVSEYRVSGCPETRPESTAYLIENPFYYCGGFNGGDAKTFLKMSSVLRANIDRDRDRGITAIWHDESQINRYLFDHPPAKTLSPSYCYPENYDGKYGWSGDIYPPILTARDKQGQR